MMSRPSGSPLPNDQPAVRTLDEADVGAASGIIMRAFHDDPGSVFLVPVPDDREPVLMPFFERAVRTCLDRGVALGTEGPDGLDAVLLSTPPGPVEQIALADEATSAPAVASDSDPGAEGSLELRIGPFFGAMHDMIEAVLPATAWYLDFLATDPSMQGRGRASTLVGSLHDLVDAKRGQIGLLTFTSSNVVFYERRGYRVTGVRDFAEGGFTMWAMTREPAESIAGPA